MPEGKELVGPNAPPRVTRPMAGTERLHVVQWNVQTQSWDSRVAWAEDIAALGGGGGGGGEYNPTLRVISPEDGVPMEGGALLYPSLDGDVNNSVIAPYSQDAHVMGLPTTAADLGDMFRVVHGNPEDALSGYPPEDPQDLYLGYFNQYAQEGDHIGIAMDGNGPAAIPYGAAATLLKTNEVVFGGVTYHFWKVIALTGVAATGGGGGTVVRWGQEVGYDIPELLQYYSFGDAVDALNAVGGGTLEMVRNGTLYGGDVEYNDYDMSNIDLVGAVNGFRTLLTIGGAIRLNNLRSIRGITIDRQNAPDGDLGVIMNGGGNGKLIVEDCDLGDAYPAAAPIVYGARYLHLLGVTVLGEGTVATAADLYLYARDSAYVAEDAIAAEQGMRAYVYESAYVDQSQVGVLNQLAIERVAQERFLSYDVDELGNGMPLLIPGAYINANTANGDVPVAVFQGYRNNGRIARVAKRGDGGNVVISGLTFVPGAPAQTTYTITEENAVVELHWTPNGVQVKP